MADMESRSSDGSVASACHVKFCLHVGGYFKEGPRAQWNIEGARKIRFSIPRDTSFSALRQKICDDIAACKAELPGGIGSNLSIKYHPLPLMLSPHELIDVGTDDHLQELYDEYFGEQKKLPGQPLRMLLFVFPSGEVPCVMEHPMMHSSGGPRALRNALDRSSRGSSTSGPSLQPSAETDVHLSGVMFDGCLPEEQPCSYLCGGQPMEVAQHRHAHQASTTGSDTLHALTPYLSSSGLCPAPQFGLLASSLSNASSYPATPVMMQPSPFGMYPLDMFHPAQHAHLHGPASSCGMSYQWGEDACGGNAFSDMLCCGPGDCCTPHQSWGSGGRPSSHPGRHPQAIPTHQPIVCLDDIEDAQRWFGSIALAMEASNLNQDDKWQNYHNTPNKLGRVDEWCDSDEEDELRMNELEDEMLKEYELIEGYQKQHVQEDLHDELLPDSDMPFLHDSQRHVLTARRPKSLPKLPSHISEFGGGSDDPDDCLHDVGDRGARSSSPRATLRYGSDADSDHGPYEACDAAAASLADRLPSRISAFGDTPPTESTVLQYAMNGCTPNKTAMNGAMNVPADGALPRSVPHPTTQDFGLRINYGRQPEGGEDAFPPAQEAHGLCPSSPPCPSRPPDPPLSPRTASASDWRCRMTLVDQKDVKIVRKIGEGAFGEVSEAIHPSLGTIAIKWLKVRRVSKERMAKYAEKFGQEAEMLSSLTHPNIITLYGLIIEDAAVDNSPVVGIITEYCITGTLSQYLRTTPGPLSLRDRCRIACMAARGMSYLHDKRIVHFDLKPDNLFIVPYANSPTVKVGDFGLAKIKLHQYVSTCHDLRGTLPYMAPELLIAPEHVDGKCDVYSFGVVLWEMLTQQMPFEELAAQDIMAGLFNGTLRLPIPDSCEPEWRRLIEVCMDPSPSQRPTFKQLVFTLQGILDGVDAAGQHGE